jgi:hypothetical protein
MNPDRKQMMDERKSLMREFRQVRQTMVKFPAKGKREKNDVDPREVLREIRERMIGRREEPRSEGRSVIVMDSDNRSVCAPTVEEVLP